MTQIIFYIFGAMLLLSATMVVVIKNPIHAALFLVLSFFSSAAIWLLLNAEFLAIALVLVYVGAVMVLFLFVVMMLDINLATLREGFARYFPLGIIIALLMVIAMGMVVGSDYFSSDTYKQMSISATQSNTKLLGLAIYTDYLYQFEIAGAILLVAIIAAISLSMSKLKITKSTHPNEQVLAKKEDRLRVVKMKSEEKEG
jgi:NADH-quinone oxidoreductase subunit J|tara:strand:- start:1491 stop:2090 length:600 start_codon:yes stop_codon:yes gene_type:complete